MSTMLERVARAICDRILPRDAKMADGTPYWHLYVEDARAIVEAMRDASPAVLRALWDSAPVHGYDVEYDEKDAPEWWSSVIDAILAEDTP